MALAVSLNKQPVVNQSITFTQALQVAFGGKLIFEFAKLCTIPPGGELMFFEMST